MSQIKLTQSAHGEHMMCTRVYTLVQTSLYSNIKMNDSVVYFNVLLSILMSNRWNIQQSCQRKFVMKTKLFTPLIMLV